jgi:FkbM family methyltransferase
MDKNDYIVMNYLKNIINLNSILVDVGSNYGEYTDFFKLILNGTGKIYSIELDSTTFSTLESKFNNDNNIILINKAVSDIDGIIDYYQGNDAFTNNIIGYDTSFKVNIKKGKIQSITLDKLLNDEVNIDLIKIDVEGAELKVLNGMKNIINKIKILLVECHFDEDWKDINKILIEDNNFRCINVITNEKITTESKRPYQCLCFNNLYSN